MKENDSLVIYKYPLKALFGLQKIQMPISADIIKFAMQNGIPTLWALVDPETKYDLEEISILTVGTGHLHSELMHSLYIDTYFVKDLVLHVFKVE